MIGLARSDARGFPFAQIAAGNLDMSLPVKALMSDRSHSSKVGMVFGHDSADTRRNKHIGRPIVNHYRCYFLDPEDHIKAAEDIECDALNEAVERALAMLRGRPQHHSIEVWQGARRVYPVNPSPST